MPEGTEVPTRLQQVHTWDNGNIPTKPAQPESNLKTMSKRQGPGFLCVNITTTHKALLRSFDSERLMPNRFSPCFYQYTHRQFPAMSQFRGGFNLQTHRLRNQDCAIFGLHETNHPSRLNAGNSNHHLQHWLQALSGDAFEAGWACATLVPMQASGYFKGTDRSSQPFDICHFIAVALRQSFPLI